MSLVLTKWWIKYKNILLYKEKTSCGVAEKRLSNQNNIFIAKFLFILSLKRAKSTSVLEAAGIASDIIFITVITLTNMSENFYIPVLRLSATPLLSPLKLISAISKS